MSSLVGCLLTAMETKERCHIILHVRRGMDEGTNIPCIATVLEANGLYTAQIPCRAAFLADLQCILQIITFA